MTRRLPAIASNAARLAAAKIVSDQLCAEMRESELTRALWLQQPARWHHEITPRGDIISQIRY